MPRSPNHWVAESPNNVVSTFFSTINLLLKDLRFEHGGAKLVSFPRRNLNLIRTWPLACPRSHDCTITLEVSITGGSIYRGCDNPQVHCKHKIEVKLRTQSAHCLDYSKWQCGCPRIMPYVSLCMSNLSSTHCDDELPVCRLNSSATKSAFIRRQQELRRSNTKPK